MDASDDLYDNKDVLSLNPTFVEIDSPRGLIERAQAGDADAYCDLCRPYEARLFRQAMALCGNPTLAEDLAQDTLIEGWRCLRRHNGRCQFFTWLCAILLNRFRNAVRKKGAWSMTAFTANGQELQEQLANLVDRDSLPDEVAQLREQSQLVLECIQALPPKQLQVIYLRFYVDQSLEGIAAALDCSVGTVKSRLFHALERLRNMQSLRTESVKKLEPRTI